MLNKAPAERGNVAILSPNLMCTTAAHQPAPPGAVRTANLEIDPVLAGAVCEVFAEVPTR